MSSPGPADAVPDVSYEISKIVNTILIMKKSANMVQHLGQLKKTYIYLLIYIYINLLFNQKTKFYAYTYKHITLREYCMIDLAYFYNHL